jgi:hypothetical protein
MTYVPSAEKNKTFFDCRMACVAFCKNGNRTRESGLTPVGVISSDWIGWTILTLKALFVESKLICGSRLL